MLGSDRRGGRVGVLLLMLVLAGIVTSAAFGGSTSGYPRCAAGVAPAFTLVAPRTLPVTYPSGFYIYENPGPNSPYGRYLHQFESAGVTAADGAQIDWAYTDESGERRGEYGRWPLRFE